jgi:hypothetical protein
MNGSITATKSEYFGLSQKAETSEFSLLKFRDVSISEENLGCYTGDWLLHTWYERRGRQGVGNVLGLPQARYLGATGWLSVDRAGIVQWGVTVSPPSLGGYSVELRCRGSLDEKSGRIMPANVTWNYGGVQRQVAPNEAEEFGYALCGRGLSLAQGRSMQQDFVTKLLVQLGARTLQMDNSEGTFRWVRR